ncbi:MAG: hypothetical protein WA775_01185 [Psychroserpens sp.]|uniref:hypothetical protein n=1 Tax=Psychroserpens sp. TaxID=2020870 RepID=UPI003C9B6E62
MTVFESLNQTKDKAADNAEKYLKSSKEYAKLKAFHYSVLASSFVARSLAVGVFLIIAMIFLSVAGAIVIGETLDNGALGFLIIGAIYLVFSFLGYLVRHRITTSVLKQLSSKFYKHS